MAGKFKVDVYLLGIVCLLSYFEIGELRSLIYFNRIILMVSLFMGIWIFFSRGRHKISKYDFCWLLAIICFVVIRNRYIENGETDYNILYYLLLVIFIIATKSNTRWVKFFVDYMYYVSLLHAAATIVFAFSRTLFEFYTSHFLAQEYYVEAMTRYSNGTISGLCVNYGVNAGIIAIGTGISIVRLLYSENKIRIRNFLPVAIRLGGLLFTGKRSPVLLLMAAIGIIYIFIEKGKTNRKIFKVVSVGTLAVILFFVGAMFIPQMQVLIGRLLDSDDWSTLGGRTELYELAFRMFEENPLIGQGWNSYKLVSETTIGRTYASQYARMQTHNIYLQLLSEVGVIGFVSIVLLLVVPLYFTFRATRRYGIKEYLGNYSHGRARKDLLSCIFILLFFLLYGMTGNPLYDPYMYFLGLMSCAALQAYRVSFKKQQ